MGSERGDEGVSERAQAQAAGGDDGSTPGPSGASGGAVRARRGRRWWWWVLAVVLPPVLIRGLLFEVYAIQSGSMEPTFAAGDRLVVLRTGADSRPMERWDVVVVDSDVSWDAMDEVDTLIKRVVGLPDEFLRLRDGDVYVVVRGSGQVLPRLVRKPDALVRELLIPVHTSDGMAAPWVWTGATERIELPDGSMRLTGGREGGEAVFEQPVNDWLPTESAEVEGDIVADTALLVEIGTVDGVLTLSLREGADVFRARLAPRAEGGASLHHNLAVARGVVDSDEAFAGLDPGARVLMWNVDNQVRVYVGETLLLAYDYDANAERAPGSPIRNEPRLAIEDGSVELRRLEVLRDLHFTGDGNFGGDSGAGITPCPLGPDELFLVGDHSRGSHDSRFFGPVPAGAVRGRPVARYLPLSRLSRLTPLGLSR